ncbi:hypothetical protein RRG08_056464 [Elysia crispata]|uniref:Uncharacterized protein n=1 Tax=Elysia crispata TaxID=231223 RepID=A0AAE0XRP6_9GAST|nr:hypothetical protein RRG08_056464 [Elysia crispata]
MVRVSPVAIGYSGGVRRISWRSAGVQLIQGQHDTVATRFVHQDNFSLTLSQVEEVVITDIARGRMVGEDIALTITRSRTP